MIHLTEAAAKEIRKVRSDEGLDESIPIRIGIKGGGCSGFTYTFEFDAKAGKFDLEFESGHENSGRQKKSSLYRWN